MTLNRTVFAALIFHAFVLGACANKGSGDRNKTSKIILSEEAKILTGIPLSDEKNLLGAPAQPVSCDIKKAVESSNTILALKEDDSLNAKTEQLFSHCLGIFACSKSAQEFIQQKFTVESSKIRIGIADFKKMGIGKDKNSAYLTIQGMYLSNTDGIYIDSELKDGFGVCSILYHEMIHRFDGEAKNRDNPLRVEYRAYYGQVQFSGEFEKETKNAGLALTTNQLPHRNLLQCAGGQTIYVNHSRYTLMDFVSKFVSKPSDLDFANSFKPYDWEPVAGCPVVEETKSN